MNEDAPLRVGTRASELARIQTERVRRMLAAVTSRPIQTVVITTRGDSNQDVPLHAIEGKGFFTREIEEALLDGRIDVAVHSLKDLPTESSPGLAVVAIPEREDPSELLLVREGRFDARLALGLPHDAVVGTSSRRRAVQLLDARPDLMLRDLRGNVPTRIRKLCEGLYDAILIARAGFLRLGMRPSGYRAIPLPVTTFLPAPGQGALGIQGRADDRAIRAICAGINDPTIEEAVTAERMLLDLLGGGCSLPLGAWAERKGERLCLEAVFAPGSGEERSVSPDPLLRVRVAGASASEVARRAADVLLRERVPARTAPRVLVPIIANGAADPDTLRAELADLTGGLVCLHPLLEVAPVGEGIPRHIRASWPEFDWLLLSSVNAVRFLDEALREGGLDARARSPRLKIGCVGPDTAKGARAIGLDVDLVAPDHTSEGLARAILAACADQPARVLLPQPRGASGTLPRLLREGGHAVTEWLLYETRPLVEPPPLPFSLRAGDLFVLRSPSAARAFARAYGSPGPADVVAMGPSTAAAVVAEGWHEPATPANSDRLGLIEAVRGAAVAIGGRP